MTRAARLLPLLAALLALPVACKQAGPEAGLPGVRPADLRKAVEFLASDELGGREVGGAGIARAEQYIAGRFAASGLKPLPGRRGFFQEFTVYRTGLEERSLALVLRTPDGELTAAAGRDFRPFPFSGSGELSAPVLFAGYGITAPEYDWDDYRGLEVRGSFVLVLRHEPGNADPRSRFAGRANTTHAYFQTKAENARRRGAAGLLLVDDPLAGGGEEDLSLQASWSLRAPSPAAPPPGAGFLAVHISRELAGKLLAGVQGRAGAGLDLLRLQEAVDAGRRPASLAPAGLSASLRIPPAETRELRARNVVGFLEGGDPALRDQWLLIGAHHDHLGSTDAPGDSIYNGADDNASGVAGVLALARLFARSGAWRPADAGAGEVAADRAGGRRAARLPALPGWIPLRRFPAPRRSIVFATFSAEEQGLLGSQVLARELAGSNLVRMLNLDMIGRNPQEPVEILADEPEEVRRLVEAAAAVPPALRAEARAAQPSFRLSSGRGQMSSDHAAFFRRGVPYLFFFTGLHPDYHGVDDEADRLSYPRLAEVVALAWRVASALADAP